MSNNINLQMNNNDVNSTKIAKSTNPNEYTINAEEQTNAAISESYKEIEIKQNELKKSEKYLKKRRIALDKQEDEFLERKSNLDDMESALNKRQKELDLRKSEFDKTNTMKAEELSIELQDKKIKFEKSLCDEKILAMEQLAKEIVELRIKKVNELENQIAKESKQRLEKLSAEIEQKRNELEKEVARKKEVNEKEISQKQSEIEEEMNKLSKLKKELTDKQAELDKTKEDLEFEKRRYETRKNKLDEREADIPNEIDERVKDEKDSFDIQLADKNDELKRLRTEIRSLSKINDELESFKVAYGEDPRVFRAKYEVVSKEVKDLKDELANRPSIEIKERLHESETIAQKLKQENESLKNERDILLKERAESESFELKNQRLTSDNADLKSQVCELENKNEDYRQRIERLSSQEGRVAEREERIKDIKLPIVKFKTEDGKYSDVGKQQPENEIEWLSNIEEKCKQYGIIFPKRILYAYHTALKISDWSPMTVLAGVSGTGKSELPRLYAAFGGINFINVAVQPNWDSQESMLGFFNSIDNKFDAQPLLRYLTQCTEDLKNYVSIALLDEMNLAHVEHYFADFLSKLEERRGKTNQNMPHIDVKLGSGIAPFELKMRRNILWTGTMNQDETTKSLSDKVLDRGIIINFPRPTKLISRKEMGKMEDLKSDTLLRYDTWAGSEKHGKIGWVKRKLNFTESQLEEIKRFKEIVEEINQYLGAVGRAIGHRVWQSIEYYIANYPTVSSLVQSGEQELTPELRKQMHIAFEDQIVQKIMPKLRGIDTRGKSKTECLDKIKKMLEDNNFNLTEDFDNACEFGYGQFIWNSANYISVGDGDDKTEKVN